MKSYSQYGQDKFVYDHYFKNQKTGTFVEIGADDGIRFSNTKMFEDLGWAGLCVEPRHSAFEKLVKNRNCFCEKVAVWKDSGEFEFLDIEGYGKGLSGLTDAYCESHRNRIKGELASSAAKDSKQNTMMVECVHPNDLLDKYNLWQVDFMSIDTEGSELDILKEIDYDHFSIRCFTVENNYKDPKMENFMASKGYRRVKVLDIDEIYVR